MTPATVPQLKKELSQMTQPELVAVAMKLIKYKKDNKELMSYLLFEAENEAQYIQSVKEEIDEVFSDMSRFNGYLAKKSVRKALRIANKYIKYSSAPGTDVEILMHFCEKQRKAPLLVRNSQTMINVFDRQIKRINIAIGKLHEDLQFDYKQMLEDSGLVE